MLGNLVHGFAIVCSQFIHKVPHMLRTTDGRVIALGKMGDVCKYRRHILQRYVPRVGSPVSPEEVDTEGC